MHKTDTSYRATEQTTPIISSGKSGAEILNAALELARSTDKKPAGNEKHDYIAAALQIKTLSDQAKGRIY